MSGFVTWISVDCQAKSRRDSLIQLLNFILQRLNPLLPLLGIELSTPVNVPMCSVLLPVVSDVCPGVTSQSLCVGM